MKKVKKLLAMGLSVAMILMLAACGSDSGSAETEAPATETEAAAAETEAPEAEPAAETEAAAAEEAAEPAADTLTADAFADLEPVTLVYADGAAVGAVGNLWAEAFIKNVEEITGGKISIDYYGNSQLGADNEIATQMQAGTIDMCNMQSGNLSSMIPELYAFDMPLVFAKYDTATIDKVLKPGSEFFGSLNAGFEKAGFELIDTLQAATFREMSSNKAVRSIDDFAGIKIRTMTSEYSLAFWEGLGCNPVPLAFTELYMSLQQGVVEAEENALDTQVNAKFYEVQDYVILTHHTLYLNLFYMNKAKWDSLDPLYQQAITQANQLADDELQPQLQGINDDSRATMEANGVEVIELDDATLDAIIEKAQPVYDSVRGAIGDEICDQLINGLEAAAAGGDAEAAPEEEAAAEEEAAPEAAAPAAATLAAADFEALEPITLVYADGAAVGAVGNLWAEAFIKNVEEITGGKISIDYYGNSQLGADNEIATQMQAGTIDMCNMQSGNLSSMIPELYAFDMPLVFAKYDTATIDKVLKPGSDFFNSLNAGFEKAGFELIDTLQAATFREMSSNKAVRSIDDFAGIKIRTMTSEYSLAFWEGLGCNPVPLAFTELYMSLQQGVVEAEENALDTQVNAKFYEVQDYVILTHHTLYLNLFYMNKAKWDSLDPLYQQAIVEANSLADAELQPQLQGINDDSRATMEANGVEVIELDDATLDAIIEKAQPVYDSVRGAIGDEICDQLINGLEAAAQ